MQAIYNTHSTVKICPTGNKLPSVSIQCVERRFGSEEKGYYMNNQSCQKSHLVQHNNNTCNED